MKKRILSVIFAAILGTGLLAGCGSAASDASGTSETSDAQAEEQNVESGEEKVINIAVMKTTYIAYLAEALGYFEEEFEGENTKVELTEFTLGPPIIEAIGSDQIDIGLIGDLPTYSGLVNGGEYTIIGKYSDDTAKALIVRKDANINSLKDLEGHIFAVPFGSNMQPLAEIYLEEAGLTVNDVEYTNLAAADIVTSIVNGDIDAAVSREPEMSKIFAATDEVEILETADGYKEFVCPIVARNAFLADNADETAKILSALERAAEWSHENEEEAVKLIAEATELEESDVSTLFYSQDNYPYLTDSQIDALVQGADEAYKYELITEEIDITEYIDLSYLKAAGITW